MDAWADGHVAPAEVELPVVVPKGDIKLEPVSSRLKATLQHPSRRGFLVNVGFAPDGSKVIAGSHPEGLVQIWDAASGRQLAKSAGPPTLQRNFEYFAVAPDWSQVYTAAGSRTVERVVRGDRKLLRLTVGGSVRAWDAATGAARREYRDDPPMCPTSVTLSPDGRRMVVGGNLSGEVAGGALPRGASLWDLATGRVRRLPANLAPFFIFAPDATRFAVARQDGASNYRWIDLLDAETGAVVRTISAGVEFVAVRPWAFSPDGRRLYGGLSSYRAMRDAATAGARLAAWDVATGREVGSFAAPDPKPWLTLAPPSSDGRTLAAVTLAAGPATAGRLTLYLLDAETLALRTAADLGPKASPGVPVFRPDGKLVAVVLRPETDAKSRRDPPPEELPQPRIALVDVATGKVRATLVLPQCFCGSMAFSPDGKTLAAGGLGQVLGGAPSPPAPPPPPPPPPERRNIKTRASG